MKKKAMCLRIKKRKVKKEDNMLRKNVTPKIAVSILNNALEMDREAVQALIDTRVPCNAKLAEHDTIQVAEAGPSVADGEMEYSVCFMGLLNGLFGVDERTGYGPIMAVFENEDPNDDGPGKLLLFAPTVFNKLPNKPPGTKPKPVKTELAPPEETAKEKEQPKEEKKDSSKAGKYGKRKK